MADFPVEGHILYNCFSTLRRRGETQTWFLVMGGGGDSRFPPPPPPLCQPLICLVSSLVCCVPRLIFPLYCCAPVVCSLYHNFTRLLCEKKRNCIQAIPIVRTALERFRKTPSHLTAIHADFVQVSVVIMPLPSLYCLKPLVDRL